MPLGWGDAVTHPALYSAPCLAYAHPPHDRHIHEHSLQLIAVEPLPIR